MDLQILFWVIVVGVIGYFVTRSILHHLALKRLGWKWVDNPDLRITVGLNHSPFGLGFNRTVRDQVVGRSHGGVPFQAFRYGSDFWKDQNHIVCVSLPHSMPPFYRFTATSPLPGIGGPHPSDGTQTMLFFDQSYGGAVAAAIGPFLSELDARQLTIDHDQLVMFGVKSDLKSLEAAVELLVRIQAAIASSPAVSHEYESAPLHVSFTDHPDWQYTDCDNSLLNRLPLEQGGYDHEVVNVVQSLGGPITFIRVTHNWKTRNAKNEWSSTREHTEHFCSFGIGFKFIPVSVNMGRGRAQKFESIEFNERFKVRCPSARFASDVFHQRQIEHLLRTSPVGFAITPEGNIQVADGEWLPEQIGAMLVFFQEFFGWIPDFVWQELGAWPRPIPKQRG